MYEQATTSAGVTRPLSQVETAYEEATKAQSRLTDALIELKRRLEPAMSSDYPAPSGKDVVQVEPSSVLVAGFRQVETTANAQATLVGEIIQRLTL